MKKLSYLLLIVVALCFFAADANAQKKTKKDIDGDGVPNKMDNCPNIPGINNAEMRGCPDSDGDGITDGDDLCPLDKGEPGGSSPGCPGSVTVTNSATQQASAPKLPGSNTLKPLKGDRDGDGVADKEDSCPDIPGANNPGARGCPDRDNDWVTDDQDKCPDERGIGQYMGCPDDPDPALKIALKQKEARDSVSIDSLRNIFYVAYDKCYTDFERRDAVVQFARNISAVCGGHTWAASQYAIKPVMQGRVAGKPNLGQYIAGIWERETGLYSYIVEEMMTKADLNYLGQQQQAKYEAEQKAEKEKMAQQYAPTPSKPLTAAEECQLKKYEAQQGRGVTYHYHGDLVIMSGYDCEKGEYIMLRPKQGDDGYTRQLMERLSINPDFGRWVSSIKQYHRCGECDGTGQVLKVTYTTRTKELPWGYFSGIETTKTTTKSTTTQHSCNSCGGTGVVLK